MNLLFKMRARESVRGAGVGQVVGREADGGGRDASPAACAEETVGKMGVITQAMTAEWKPRAFRSNHLRHWNLTCFR